MPTYLIRYQQRTRELREVAMLHVEPTPCSDWTHHELDIRTNTRLDRRRAATLIRARLNDQRPRRRNRLQVRITSLEEAPA